MMINGRHQSFLPRTDRYRMDLPISFQCTEWYYWRHFHLFLNSLWPQFFMEAWACWRLTHNVERCCCSCHHMNWQWVLTYLLWPPCQYLQQFLLILESLFTVCSSTTSGESELNDDSEAWWCSNSVGSILSELSMYTVGATSCSIFTPVKQTVPHLK